VARRTTARKEHEEFGDEPGPLRSLLFDDYGIRGQAVAIGIGILVIVIIVFAVWADRQDDKSCKASGGHRVTHTYHGTSSDGKFVTLTNTECVHDQQR
jgi:hypothetical protein